jgi:hypothetical protein
MAKKMFELHAEIEIDDDDEDLPLEALETDLLDVLSLSAETVEQIPYSIRVTNFELSQI